MSFNLERLNRYTSDYGTDTYIANGTVNSYAPVTNISTTSITIDRTKMIEGAHLQFVAGAEIFIHVSASRDGSKAYLGCWTFAEIQSVTDNTLTLDRDITADIPARILTNYYIQALTVPFFGTNADSPIQNNISPPAFDVDKMCGGVLVVKCVTMTMGGAGTDVWNYNFLLANKGIPTTHKTLRPWFEYEKQGTLDTDPYAGWENAMLEHRLPLNVGDGAALIYASSGVGFTFINYIGNNVSVGKKFCRGASDSYNVADGVTNIGGSTALIIFKERTSSVPFNFFDKYRATTAELGQGLGARMIVTANIGGNNFNDGGLYSHMRTHHDLPSALKVPNVFGNGSFGSLTDAAAAKKQMNNYALVTTTSTSATYNTKKISYAHKTTTGLAPIEAGALVMVEVFNTVTWHTVGTYLCNVLADDGANLTLDKAVNLGANRQAMVVSIPQFKNFTFSGTNTATPKFNNGIGGIFAIACSGTCDLSAAKISVLNKGGVPINTSDPSLVERYNILTLGQGYGSILILANKLTLSTDTRLGIDTESNHGNRLGGRGALGSVVDGVATTSSNVAGGGYRGKSVADSNNFGGFGGGGGTGKHSGGFFANGTRDADITNLPNYGLQGAHLMIIADTITNFNVNAICTGGIGWALKNHGGAGYGGGGAGNGAGGGFRGGGAGDFASGGAAGYAFIYCNNHVNPITDGIILDE